MSLIMNTPTTTPDIFSLPPLVIEKVCLSEILNLLRERVNKSYMPSATGQVRYNSKPRYVDNSDNDFPNFPYINSLEASGYFAHSTKIYRHSDCDIFYNLHIAEFQIVINLTTDQAIIRLITPAFEPDNAFVEWKDDPAQAIPLMRDELKEIIDIYG